MTVSSMTGFARMDGHEDGVSWVWEVKSVNSKSLDLRFRLPPGFEALELPLRAGIAQRLKRGSVSVSLALAKAGAGNGVRLNRDALALVVALAQQLVAEGKAAPPRADGLLALRGVLESGEEVEDEARRERRQAALLQSFESALQALAGMRQAEGERLVPVLETRLAEIAQLVAAADDNATVQPQALKARLADMVAQLLGASPALPPERLAQEAALLADRSDISEELIRLKTHASELEQLIHAGGEVGKKLDFLLQEMNREANTILSKTGGLGDLGLTITERALAVKSEIDKIREQSLNLE